MKNRPTVKSRSVRTFRPIDQDFIPIMLFFILCINRRNVHRRHRILVDNDRRNVQSTGINRPSKGYARHKFEDYYHYFFTHSNILVIYV